MKLFSTSLLILSFIISTHAMITANKSKNTHQWVNNKYIIKSYIEHSSCNNLIEVQAFREKDITANAIRYYVIVMPSLTMKHYERLNSIGDHWQHTNPHGYNSFVTTQERIQKFLNNPEETWLNLKDVYAVQKIITKHDI